MNNRTGPFGRVHNLRSTLVEYRMIVSFHADADDFTLLSSHDEPFPTLL